MKQALLGSNCNAKSTFFKKASLAFLAATVLGGNYALPIAAIASPIQIAQRQSWSADLKVARLANPQDSAIVLQLDILDKPATSYANAVYQIFARRNGQWTQIFTSRGARLITNAAGQTLLAPEVISLSDLRRQLGENVDFASLELKVAAQLRYDIRGQARDQVVSFEQIQTYRSIAQTTTTTLVTRRSSESIQTANRGSFSLSIAQNRPTLSKVIARVSARSKTAQGFDPERLIGDFRYKINKKAKFVKGLNAGDRVIVRLFTPDNQFIGYSEFELLSEKAAVTLVLPERPLETRIVRTVYGMDANQDYEIDRNAQVFDYFTQVTQVNRRSYLDSRVTFLRSVQSSILRSFTLANLPAPRQTCVYPTTFTSGAFSLVSRTVQIFGSNLSPVLVALPGQRTRTIEISSTDVSVYQVNQLVVSHQGDLVVDQDGDDDDRDRKKRKKQACNQGRGNGSEGCDPGNSRPRGGSNDEDDDD